MKKIKDFLASFSLASMLGCAATMEPIREEMDDSQLVMDVYIPGRPLVIMLPCERARVRLEPDEYQIKCTMETFFIHSRSSDYLQFGTVSYFDFGHDGNVDKISFNGMSLWINNYSIDLFYQEKLGQFRKRYVETLWREYLERHPSAE